MVLIVKLATIEHLTGEFICLNKNMFSNLKYEHHVVYFMHCSIVTIENNFHSSLRFVINVFLVSIGISNFDFELISNFDKNSW